MCGALYCQVTEEEQPEDSLYKWIELRVKGHDDAVLESYAMYVSLAANELDISLESMWVESYQQFRTVWSLGLT